MVTPWTNRDQTVFAPLNDYTATVIGMVRDDVAFNTALSADILYTVNAAGLPAVSAANNDHYATAETNGVDLSTALKQTTQSGTYGIPTEATAGLITTRGAASAFFINGTNRAMFRFTMINHLCNDMQTVMDITRPTDRIRQDVARSPGGDSRLFLNTCVGCHSGMDPMAQAFAYYNFDTTSNQLVYTANQVQPKYFINSQNFIYGFVTPDNSWSNRWRAGPNIALGWDQSMPGSGVGAKSLGQELAGERCLRAVPGHEGIPDRVLPRAHQRCRHGNGQLDQVRASRPRATNSNRSSSWRLRPARVVKGALVMNRTVTNAFALGTLARAARTLTLATTLAAAGAAERLLRRRSGDHRQPALHAADELGRQLHRAPAGRTPTCRPSS